MKELGSFKGLLAVIIVAGIATLMGMVIGSNYTHNDLSAEEKPVVTSTPMANPYIDPATGHSPFVAVAQRVKPAVVNISAKSMVEDNVHNFFDDDIWRRFFGMPPQQSPNEPRMRKSESLGSGFFISPDGYILTNNHVVKDADDILVRLSDTQEFKAEVVGADSETDVALIKIKADEPMPYLDLGNSDSIMVGDWAIAVGNPFPQLGLDRTVTVGVISALGRSGLVFGQDNPVYQNYIQTDASINPGNSGGPLVGINGKVVGINSAIASPSGGNVGIGFAIPINLARKISDELKANGSVTRGWLGILPSDIDNNMAEALGLPKPEGVLVESVEDNSPAQDGGLKEGDVILKVDDKKVTDAQQFRFLIADAGPGTEVKMDINRNGDDKTLKFKLGDRSKFLKLASTGDEGKGAKKWLGLDVATFTSADAQKMGVDFEPAVIVQDVESGSAADEAGLFQGDLILEIDHNRIKNESDFAAQADRLKDRTKSILFLIKRGNRTMHKAVKPL
jgi:serine protease Do